MSTRLKLAASVLILSLGLSSCVSLEQDINSFVERHLGPVTAEVAPTPPVDTDSVNEPEDTPNPPDPVQDGELSEEMATLRDQVVQGALALVDRSSIEVRDKDFPLDCTGVVLGAYYAAGIDLTEYFGRYTGNGVSRLFQMGEEHDLLNHGPVPQPGDIIFWDNTYDRNDDQQWNDWLTHTGIVVKAYEDGTVEYVHHNFIYGIIVERMNLNDPDTWAVDRGGERFIINAQLRMPAHVYLNPTQKYASHLFRAAGSLYMLAGT